ALRRALALCRGLPRRRSVRAADRGRRVLAAVERTLRADRLHAARSERRMAPRHRYRARAAARHGPGTRALSAPRPLFGPASTGVARMRCMHSMPFGAELVTGGGRFRLWAPAAERVELLLGDRRLELERRPDGFHERVVQGTAPGDRYAFAIEGLPRPVADPASRFNPEGPDAPSEVVDPTAFEWHDGDWRGRPWRDAVFYELHVGTFTADGTLAAAAEKLPELARLGVTAIELMPIAEGPGRRSWGYDAVLPFALRASYGRPDDLKAFVQTAHRLGLMVFLDVVYNHFGPSGNYLPHYAPQFFTKRHQTPWGDAINFDGEESAPVRAFFIENALFWLVEYRFDGLRLDAVHAIIDDSEPHVLTELAETVERRITEREVHLVLENGDNEARHLARRPDGRPRTYTAQWNDDFHHAMHV